jgi:hypothetical protein
MRRTSNLEERLVEWGKEYRSSGYEDIGYPSHSSLATLMTYHGPAPQGLNPRRIEINLPADDVEKAVRELQRQKSGWVMACVLRAEYFEERSRHGRLKSLRAIGLPMRTERYSEHLRRAKIYVAAWLHIPFDEPLCDNDAVGMLEYEINREAS